ncbi:MAG: sigma-70 family RNA polymerase sigma factor [Burkholderiaceae bacterium]|nr:sigma-70 family RNA polymerase sigma factor [Burkholderiaceae bacterium]
MTDFASQVESLRPQLLRFARVQTRNEAWAEDAVSETLLVAMEKPQAFGGGSKLKTWLIGILKHKLIDQLRRNMREVSTADPDERIDLEALCFTSDGHFRDAPEDWGDPEAALGERQFFQALEACVEQLPNRLGRVFLMREWMELESGEICKQIGITPTNLSVMLHRARLRLRQCLQTNWFDQPKY